MPGRPRPPSGFLGRLPPPRPGRSGSLPPLPPPGMSMSSNLPPPELPQPRPPPVKWETPLWPLFNVGAAEAERMSAVANEAVEKRMVAWC